MKKLFLYFLIFVSIFIFSYYITLTIFKTTLKGPNEDVILTENLIEDYDIIENIELSYDNINYKNAEAANSYIKKNETNIVDDNIKYILGIDNGYVIVYLNSTDIVYEYTDIDAEILKNLDISQYNKIQNNISFDSIEELFDFLESLAS